jgi:hypothetical protein
MGDDTLGERAALSSPSGLSACAASTSGRASSRAQAAELPGSLLLIDVVGVQEYVFRSNRLRDVVGASIVVRRATDASSEAGVLAKALAAGDEGAEVLSDAGGNAVLRVTGEHHEARARSIAARYSRRLLDEAPGLDVYVHRAGYVAGRLAAGLRDGWQASARATFARPAHSPLLGLGITESCSMTGLPATTRDRRTPVSARVAKARAAGAAAGEGALAHRHRARFAVSDELDELGRTRSQRSMLGIVHVDGNAVGARIRRWLDAVVAGAVGDEEVVAQYRAWSRGLEDLGQHVQRAVFDAVIVSIDTESARFVGTQEELGFDLSVKDGRVVLPLRQVLLGGDDLTFVCDGRVALALAAVALEAFEAAAPVPHIGRVHASAGVSIVNAHAPFSGAYQLSAGLTESAKSLTRSTPDGATSALDWHLGATRPRMSVAEIRARRHHSTIRPLRLTGEAPSWQWLNEEVLDHERHGLRGDAWRDRRSKVKHLAGLAASGDDAVRRQLQAWKAVDADWTANPALGSAHRDGLFDAIELLDIHQPLGGERL